MLPKRRAPKARLRLPSSADQALYYAKQNGRNQIRVYERLVQQGLLQEQNIQTGPIELF
jgi:two-component system, cell cycle response regulator